MATETESQPQNGVPSATELEEKIIRQVEYYFGDQNLARDKFLLQKINEDDGWVTLDCLITFNRLKALSTDFEVIMNALKKSKSGLLEINEDGKKIRRDTSKPLQDINDPFFKKQAQQKTVYAKGFPEDWALDQLEDFILKHGRFVYIRMRRDADKKFKGSIFVEFVKYDDAKTFVEKEGVKCGDNDLLKMFREDYYKMKMDEVKKQKGETGVKEKQEEEEVESYENGCILHFKGCVEETKREDIKAVFGKHEEIRWVDFARNDTEGYVRFSSGGGAQRAIDGVKGENEDKVVIKDAELSVRILEGEEESAYWKKIRQEAKSVRDRKRANRGGDRGRSKKGRFTRRYEKKEKQVEQEKNTRITFDSDDESPEACSDKATKRPADEGLSVSDSKQAKVEE